MLGPDCVLVRRTPAGCRSLSRGEAAVLQVFLFGDAEEPGWLFRQARHIGDALDAGQLALAQIYGLQIAADDDLDDLRLRQLAAAAPLVRANFNPDEPRDDHGRWTDQDGSANGPSIVPVASTAPVAGSAVENATGSLLGRVSAETWSALAELAGRLNAATAFLGILFIPTNRDPVVAGGIARRPDLTYSYDPDTGILRLSQSAGAGTRALLDAHIDADGIILPRSL
jgi:hypothetical protein